MAFDFQESAAKHGRESETHKETHGNGESNC